ncbi:MAG: hypothetical protein MAG451_00887 [Anaerolineales bacterium]|nr:hypothetical protein [Anaerolineales bacterium]
MRRPAPERWPNAFAKRRLTNKPPWRNNSCQGGGKNSRRLFLLNFTYINAAWSVFPASRLKIHELVVLGRNPSPVRSRQPLVKPFDELRTSLGMSILSDVLSPSKRIEATS